MSAVWLGVTSEPLWPFLPFLTKRPQSQGSQEWTWGSKRETRSLAVETCTRRQRAYLRTKFWLVRQDPIDLCLQKTSRWWSPLLSILCPACFNGMKRCPRLGLGIFGNGLQLSNMCKHLSLWHEIFHAPKLGNNITNNCGQLRSWQLQGIVKGKVSICFEGEYQQRALEKSRAERKKQ